MSISSLFFVVITSLVAVLYLLRALKLVFNGNILKHSFFDFPDGKSYKIGYCLCIVVLGLVAIYFRLY